MATYAVGDVQGCDDSLGKLLEQVAFDPARHEHARKRLAGRELQVGIVLVVAQQDVVFGRPLLDQVVLERQRLHHRVGDDDLEMLCFVEEGVYPRAGAMRAEVAADAIPQHARLADVQGFPGPVRIEVHAGLLRQTGDLGLEITDRHAVHCAFWRTRNPSL